MTEPSIRPATEDDLPAITEIYNRYVRETPVTFDVEPRTLEDRCAWFAQFGETGRYRILVAEDRRQIVGYACSTRVRPKAAYDPSVEVTIYLRPEAKRRGIGRALYGGLFELLGREEIHRAYAVITLPNETSIRLHEVFGFRHTGTLNEVGRKFERYWDVAWYEKRLD